MAGEMVFAQVLPQVALGISGVVAQLPERAGGVRP